jgi:hypothetical protein
VQAVNNNPLVVFMKGTPEMPQCGFSRAVCQILDVQVGQQAVVRGVTSLGSEFETADGEPELTMSVGCAEGESEVVQLP